MTVIKKIRLNLVEKYLEEVVVSCSQIKVAQHEMKYVKSRMEDNKKDLSSGEISESLYNNKSSTLMGEEKKLKNKIKVNIKKSLSDLNKLRKLMDNIEI